ncbi:MAG: tetratricopeptide repeat protein [Syntrophobacteraceae bacterium]|nr:tetratricopeptide repeat protein [Syntrophobacteraceae bacterium]
MRRLSVLYVALIAALVSGCATTPRQRGFTADQMKTLGEKALLAQDAPSSLKYLTEAEKKQPNDAVIQYDLGLAYNLRGFDAQALEHIQKALKIKPDYPEALNTLGYMYATRGQFDLAKEAFEKAMNNAFYQTPQMAALNLGELYEKRGDSQMALVYYRKAVKLDPHYAQAWFRVGKMLEKSGNNEEAKQAYETALRESPEMAEAHLRMGIIAYNAGAVKEAAGAFSQVERLAPNSNLSTEAQSYMEKINNPEPAATPFHYQPARLKPKKFKDPRKLEPPSPPVSQNTGDPAATTEQSANASGQTGAPGGENGAAPPNTTAVNPPSPLRYVVKVGSYQDKAKAEDLKSRLAAKGYNAVVRHVPGHDFVVELKSVDTFSKASTLQTQVTGETNDPPKIIKLPAR